MVHLGIAALMLLGSLDAASWRIVIARAVGEASNNEFLSSVSNRGEHVGRLQLLGARVCNAILSRAAFLAMRVRAKVKRGGDELMQRFADTLNEAGFCANNKHRFLASVTQAAKRFLDGVGSGRPGEPPRTPGLLETELADDASARQSWVLNCADGTNTPSTIKDVCMDVIAGHNCAMSTLAFSTLHAFACVNKVILPAELAKHALVTCWLAQRPRAGNGASKKTFGVEVSIVEWARRTKRHSAIRGDETDGLYAARPAGTGDISHATYAQMEEYAAHCGSGFQEAWSHLSELARDMASAEEAVDAEAADAEAMHEAAIELVKV